jgi:hypothetical protein
MRDSRLDVNLPGKIREYPTAGGGRFGRPYFALADSPEAFLGLFGASRMLKRRAQTAATNLARSLL